MGNDHLLIRALPVLAAVVLSAGCTSSSTSGSAATPRPSGSASGETTPAAGSDADLPLDPAPSAAAVEGVPAARVAGLSRELSSVWGVRVTNSGGTLRGAGADAPSGMRFAVDGRTDGAHVRGYACTATPAHGELAVPAQGGADAEPDPDVLAAMETALGFLQTCADSAAADPDRATVWVRAVAREALTGTPAERRIGGVRFRLERRDGGLRLTVGSP